MSAPVKITCPDIDKVINHIMGAIKTAIKGRKELPEADDYFYDILYDLEGLDEKLEDLRNDNSQLRNWGDGLEEELHAAAQQIADLENQLEEIMQEK